MKSIRLLAALAASLTASTSWAVLNSPPPNIVTLNAGELASNYQVTVDGTAQSLTISLTDSSGAGDLDLFVRYGTPFPTPSADASFATISQDMIYRYSHYRSISDGSNESITILPSDRFPLQAGTWYVDVINSSTTDSASATISATTSTAAPTGSITFDFANPTTNSDPTQACDDAFWTDTTSVAPVGGNPGTTKGDQRKNALIYAGNQLVQQLGIQVPILVHACGAHLGGDNTSAILAHAGANEFLIDAPDNTTNFLPKKYTWYPSTLAVRLDGTSACGVFGGPCDGANNDVIEADFNEDIGSSTVLNGEDFYYGYTPGTNGKADLDFISIAMHEMTHGLGFEALVNTDPTSGPVGAKAGLSTATPGVIAYSDYSQGPWDDIFDDYVAIVDQTANTYTPFLGYEVTSSRDAARAAAMVSGPTVKSSGDYNPGVYTGIRWSDATAATSSVNIHAGTPAPQDFPSLYAPCDESSTTTCATQPSSTLSHTVQAGDMMNAYYSSTNLRSMGLAVPMLAPLGWSNSTATAPTFPVPVTGNWFDVSHSGHGFDFQLYAHDATNGDVYGLTFYTYETNGTPEWYQATGNLVDGIFIPSLDQNGNTLHRLTYQTSGNSITGLVLDSSVPGTVVVDFNQASTSPACRNVDRSGATQLAVMNWSIGNDNDISWCVQPLFPVSSHGSPDYNGMWYAPSDSGWGFELVDAVLGSGSLISVVMYLPAANDQPNWLIGSAVLSGSSVSIPLTQVSDGYCRTCTPPSSLTGPQVGTMQLSFNGQTTGTATINVTYPGGGTFDRSNIPVSMLSVPTGH